MPHASVNGIDLYYETAGDPAGEPLLLIMGLGAQMVMWPPELADALVARGFYVIRFDNRDVGLSTMFTDVDAMALIVGALSGTPIDPPYLLADMATDAAGLLDHLGIERAHIIGASMGGMIAQQFAIDHPDKVATLTSIMSTTGDPDVGTPTDEALAALTGGFMDPPTDRESAVQAAFVVWQIIGSPGRFDEVRVRRITEESYDRNPDRTGMMRQLAAIVTSPSRTAGLGAVTAPTLVIHGEADPLVQPSGGVRTAEAVPGAILHLVPGMGHDVEPDRLDELLPLLVEHAAKAPITASAPTA